MPIEPGRGEVWLVDLEPTRGAEMRKVRPVVVVSPPAVGRLPLRIVVPVTTWSDAYARSSWLTRIDPDPENGLSRTSAADSFQIRSVSIERMHSRLGRVSPLILDEILDAVLLCTGYGEPDDPAA